jgi:signal transduction histidine kinase
MRMFSRGLKKELAETMRELQAANDRLKILDELKSEFVSLASHELRSPLSSMKMGVATVANEMVGPLNDEQKMMLEIAERNIDRLTKLSTDLLDLTKIEAGQFDLELEQHDLNKLAMEVVDSGRLLAEEKGLRLEVVFSKEPVVARCDRERLYQATQNLVANALNFTEEGPVTVVVGRAGDSVAVEVADTGPGIDGEAVKTIFEKWSQAHSETSSEKRGTGLGLAIFKGIVEAHGGGISVTSEPGKGSTFRFWVPVRGPDE